MKKVLVVEDDKEIRKLLKDYLEEREYEVTEAGEGNEASSIIASKCFDVVLMDMMLPFKSGDELIRELRESKDEDKRKTPVIVLSAKSMKDTRLEVLRMGADDYIVKPFDLDEVLVRIEVVLRRSEGELSAASGAGDQEGGEDIKFGDLIFSSANNSVTFKGAPVRLTAKEMMLLELFLRNPQKTFSKANLYEAVWNDTYCYDDNTVNVHMSNLRSKLKKVAGEEIIDTVWGIGYKLHGE